MGTKRDFKYALEYKLKPEDMEEAQYYLDSKTLPQVHVLKENDGEYVVYVESKFGTKALAGDKNKKFALIRAVQVFWA